MAVAKSGVYYGCTKNGDRNVRLPAGGTWRLLQVANDLFDVKEVAGNTSVSLYLTYDGSSYSSAMIAIRIA